MNYLPTILFAIVFAILLVGVFFMAIGGKLNKKYSNKLMIARVLFQAIALILLLILFAAHVSK